MKKSKYLMLVLGVLLICSGSILLLVQHTSKKTQKARVLFKDENNKILYEKKVEIGNSVERIEPTQKEGFVFIDWYQDGKVYDFSQAVSKDIVLVGMWQESAQGNVVIFYNDDDTLYETQAVSDKELVKKPKDPTSDKGGTFIGWYIEEEPFDFNTPVTERITLKARYDYEENQETEDSNTSTPGETAIPSDSDLIKEIDAIVNPAEVALKVGEEVSLNIQIVPNNASIKDYYAYCENSLVCSVSENYSVKGIAAGNTNIIVETFHGIKKKIPVTVTTTYSARTINGSLYLYAATGESVEGDVTIQFTNSSEKKTIHVPITGAEVTGEFKVLSIDVKS